MRATSTNIVAWKVFHTITKTGSSSRASIELDLSVSKLSRLLAQLEDDLGGTLIDRGRRPLQPTAFGQKALAILVNMDAPGRRNTSFPTADQKLYPQFLFKGPDGIGQGRLRDVELLSRLVERM